MLYIIPDTNSYFVDKEGNIYSKISGEIKTLSQIGDGGGYLTVRIKKRGVCKRYKVHRLIAETFLPNFHSSPQVNHKNGVKTDNRVENLEMCTAQDNIKHAIAFGLSNPRLSAQHCEITFEIAEQIRQSSLDARQAAEYFGISRRTIYDVRAYKTWNRVGEYMDV